MKAFTNKDMLKNRDLQNEVLDTIISTLVGWDNSSTQSKLEVDINNRIENTIDSNLSGYFFNNFQVYSIIIKFNSSKEFLENFYKVNPDIGSIVHETIYEVVASIQLILDGVRLEKPLEYYSKWFNLDLKILQYFSNDYAKEQEFNELIQKNIWLIRSIVRQ